MRAREVLAVATAVAVLVLAGCSQRKQPAETGGGAAKAQTTCPVMEGAPIDKSIYADYQGKRVYFCCPACPPAFRKDPEKYVKKIEDQGVVLEKAPVAQAWTCPMHPEVMQDKPGKCPICSMALVPAGNAGDAKAGSGRHEEGMHHDM